MKVFTIFESMIARAYPAFFQNPLYIGSYREIAGGLSPLPLHGVFDSRV